MAETLLALKRSLLPTRPAARMPRCDCESVAARLAELRVLDPKRLARDRAKLVLAHGQALAQFATQALDDLPKDASSPAAAEESTKRLVRCAHEATQLILLLRAFPSPTPEKLCYNVASRCALLGEHEAAAGLSMQILGALRKPPRKAADSKRAVMDSAGSPAARCDVADDACAPLGGESAESCVLATSAVGLHLKALHSLLRDGPPPPSAPDGPSTVQRMRRSLPLALGWLRQLHGVDQPCEGRKENASVRPGSPATAGASARVVPIVQGVLAALRGQPSVPPAVLDAWEAEAAALGRYGAKKPCAEASAVAAAAKILLAAAPLGQPGESFYFPYCASRPVMRQSPRALTLPRLSPILRHPATRFLPLFHGGPPCSVPRAGIPPFAHHARLARACLRWHLHCHSPRGSCATSPFVRLCACPRDYV